MHITNVKIMFMCICSYALFTVLCFNPISGCVIYANCHNEGHHLGILPTEFISGFNFFFFSKDSHHFTKHWHLTDFFRKEVGVMVRVSVPLFIVCYWLLGLSHVVHWSRSNFSTMHCTDIYSKNRHRKCSDAMRLLQCKMRLNTGTKFYRGRHVFLGLSTKIS